MKKILTILLAAFLCADAAMHSRLPVDVSRHSSNSNRTRA